MILEESDDIFRTQYSKHSIGYKSDKELHGRRPHSSKRFQFNPEYALLEQIRRQVHENENLDLQFDLGEKGLQVLKR